ncbi:MAG TPA: tRNA (adenosine(37)-N6)-threonylcarbamoyltransferase complex dimerization subunit type 1 TsaB [Nannocystis sp.]|jgi:tRNA threonylcarbamoyl adenosine modification protein YeaZ
MATIWLLALDTSTPCTALALGRVDRDTGAHELVAHATHDDRKAPASSLLAPRISALLGEAGISARQLGAVGCGVGPGMFTGTRVALATAKGLAFALPCPLFVVSTLAAVAGGAARDGEVLALLDARRGEVYAGRFTLGPAGPQMQGEARCCPIAQVLLDMAGGPDLQVIGPGAAAQAEALVEYTTLPTIGATGAGLWRAAARGVLQEAPADLDNVDAVYLRASYAELGTNTPRRTPYRSPFA